MADQKIQNQGSQQPQTGSKNPQGQQSQQTPQTGTSSTDYNKKREDESKLSTDKDRKGGMRSEETSTPEDRNLKTPRAEEEEETTDEERDQKDSSRQSG